jgi:hypothetical protein
MGELPSQLARDAPASASFEDVRAVDDETARCFACAQPVRGRPEIAQESVDGLGRVDRGFRFRVVGHGSVHTDHRDDETGAQPGP